MSDLFWINSQLVHGQYQPVTVNFQNNVTLQGHSDIKKAGFLGTESRLKELEGVRVNQPPSDQVRLSPSIYLPAESISLSPPTSLLSLSVCLSGCACISACVSVCVWVWEREKSWQKHSGDQLCWFMVLCRAPPTWLKFIRNEGKGQHISPLATWRLLLNPLSKHRQTHANIHANTCQAKLCTLS